MIVVDTNIIVDITAPDPVWERWSLDHLAGGLAIGELIINDIVFAELASRYNEVSSVERVVTEFGLSLRPLSKSAQFLAGHAFARYRRTGGAKTNVLPDFFISAQAIDLDAPLLTRNPKPYRTYFPDIELISP